MGVNIEVATMVTGSLEPSLFDLGWWDSFLCILFFNIIGSIPPALMATFGPKLGLRDMVIPRYSFGWYPAKVIALVNLLNQIGWAMVNAIARAQFLYDVGDGKQPMSVAVLIIGLLAMIIDMFGYKHVHRFERYCWIVVTVYFFIVAGFGAKHMHNTPMGSGRRSRMSFRLERHHRFPDILGTYCGRLWSLHARNSLVFQELWIFNHLFSRKIRQTFKYILVGLSRSLHLSILRRASRSRSLDSCHQ